MDIFQTNDLFSGFDEKAKKPSEPKKRRKESQNPQEDFEQKEAPISDGTPKRARQEPPSVLETPPPPTPSTPMTPSTPSTPMTRTDVTSPITSVVESNQPVPHMIPSSVNREIITCLHEVCLPILEDQSNFKPTWDESIYNPSFPANPARTWKFTLDPFQKMAVACIERNESVLVSAHTSAGKTVVAEYAIAISLKNKQRVIYTSPIKALSNQKYRELHEIFEDVGLMTGDITINPNASCLVMTTEILRSMLYRGSEIMREVAWVVFDEIHYMRDKERGVVWEETIILLPDKVHFVFLSATIPNASEFASWVAKIHRQPCHVVYTEVRPTPLQHYIFPAGGEGLFLVVDEKGQFREDNFQKALSALAPSVAENSRGRRKKPSGGPSDIYKIVKMIMERNYDPVIVFSFSKKECEALALQMAKLDFNSDEEKKLLEKIFFNAIDSLSDEDKKLPQVNSILPLLKRGVGIHHSGLLPILKEVIEILFQEGLLKALFATETFSIGLNMPAKTVVFTSVRKFDGDTFRWISSGEYIQMSGRAGRRGIDDRGIVIMMVDEKMEPDVAKNMIKGSADPLHSSFRIGYNMLLNLLRMEEMDPEYLLRRSFHQFQSEGLKPQMIQKLGALERERNSIVIEDEEGVMEYYNLQEQMNSLKQQIREVVHQPIHALPYLQPGRLVRVRDGEVDWGWGVVVNFQKKQEKGGATSLSDNGGASYIVDVLLQCDPNSPPNKPTPAPAGSTPSIQVVPVMIHLLDGISSIRVYIPKDLRPQENRLSVGKSIKEVHKKFPDGIPLLDPIEDMKIEDDAFAKLVRKLEMVEDRLLSNPNYSSNEMKEKYLLYQKKTQFDQKAKELKKQIKQTQDLILKSELKCMKRVLRRLAFTNSDDVIETKGRVACEINAADELLLTSLIFAGVFNELTVEQSVAILSPFVFQEKGDENLKLREELQGPLRKLQDHARKIAKVMQESKINIDVEEYVQGFRPHIMEVCYSWAKGAKFADICKMTDIFEGSVIRCMRRLEELLRQLTQAAKAIGNGELEDKFAQGISKIKRDIVFAASLYL